MRAGAWVILVLSVTSCVRARARCNHVRSLATAQWEAYLTNLERREEHSSAQLPARREALQLAQTRLAEVRARLAASTAEAIQAANIENPRPLDQAALAQARLLSTQEQLLLAQQRIAQDALNNLELELATLRSRKHNAEAARREVGRRASLYPIEQVAPDHSILALEAVQRARDAWSVCREAGM